MLDSPRFTPSPYFRVVDIQRAARFTDVKHIRAIIAQCAKVANLSFVTLATQNLDMIKVTGYERSAKRCELVTYVMVNTCGVSLQHL